MVILTIPCVIDATPFLYDLYDLCESMNEVSRETYSWYDTILSGFEHAGGTPTTNGEICIFSFYCVDSGSPDSIVTLSSRCPLRVWSQCFDGSRLAVRI